jgi:hypothetical protein
MNHINHEAVDLTDNSDNESNSTPYNATVIDKIK